MPLKCNDWIWLQHRLWQQLQHPQISTTLFVKTLFPRIPYYLSTLNYAFLFLILLLCSPGSTFVVWVASFMFPIPAVFYLTGQTTFHIVCISSNPLNNSLLWTSSNAWGNTCVYLHLKIWHARSPYPVAWVLIAATLTSSQKMGPSNLLSLHTKPISDLAFRRERQSISSAIFHHNIIFSIAFCLRLRLYFSWSVHQPLIMWGWLPFSPLPLSMLPLLPIHMVLRT